MPRYTLWKVVARLRQAGIDVCARTILRWEEAGKIPTAKRNASSGWREWTEDQVQKIIKWKMS